MLVIDGNILRNRDLSKREDPDSEDVRQRAEEIFNVNSVPPFSQGPPPELIAYYPINNPPAGVDNEHPRQLPDIADRQTDAVASGHGRKCLEGKSRGEKLEECGHLEAEGLV
jgi:hypothetical protein